MRVPITVLNVCQLCDLDAIRYALGSVQFSSTEDAGRAVATDGRTLLVADWDNPGEPIGEPALVSHSTCQAALTSCGTPQVFLSCQDGQVRLSSDDDGSMSIGAPAGEGRFPAVDGIMFPVNKPASVQLNLQRLKALVDTLAVVLPGEDVLVKLTIDSEGAKRVIISHDRDGLRVASVLMADSTGVKPITPEPAWLPQLPEVPKPVKPKRKPVKPKRKPVKPKRKRAGR